MSQLFLLYSRVKTKSNHKSINNLVNSTSFKAFKEYQLKAPRTKKSKKNTGIEILLSPIHSEIKT